MAENKLFDFMNVQLPDPKRSNIPWRQVNRFTASSGYIYPSAVIEVLPTDRISGNLHSILRSRPTVQSIYGSFRESHQAFFVPARLYSKTLDQLTTFSADGKFDPSVSLPLPSVRWRFRQTGEVMTGQTEGTILPGSLLNMLEMFPAMFKLSDAYDLSENTDGSYSPRYVFPDLNAIPLVAYYDILRNYYYNSQEMDMPFIQNETAFDLDLVNNNLSYTLVSKAQMDTFISHVYEGYYTGESEEDVLTGVERDLGISLSSVDVQGHTTFSQYLSAVITEDEAAVFGTHLGYGVRTFDDDYFTTALNSEYVDELNNTARVVVSNGSFSVTQMQRANRLHKYASKNVLMGFNDYEDYIYVHFNARLGREVNKPVFLGSTSNNFYFEDIYSTQVLSQNETLKNNSLGTRAGVLNSRHVSNDGFVDFTANEYGYFIVLSSIIPQISYSEGIPKMYLKSDLQDFYSPEFDAWSFQDIHPIEFSALGYEPGDPVTRSQPAWFEHLATYDRHHGLFDTDLEFGFSILSKDKYTRNDRVFDNPSVISNYVRPWEFNYIFTYQKPWFDNFEWQIMLDLNIYRPISKQILPSI